MTRFGYFGWAILALFAASEPAVAAPAQPRAAQTASRGTKPRAHKPAAAKPAAAPSKPAPTASSETAAASAPGAEAPTDAAGAGAPEAAKNASRSTEPAANGVKTFHFEAEEVEGRLRSPQILYFLRRVRAQFDPEPLGHRSFLLELSDTRRAPALW